MTNQDIDSSQDQRDAIAEEYSARARAARLEQGKPEVIADQTALLRISALMSDSGRDQPDSLLAG